LAEYTRLGRHQRALLAGVQSHRFALLEEQEGGQRAARLDASGGDQLRSFEDVDGREVAIFGFAIVDVSQGGVGGAEVDADLHGVVRVALCCMGLHRDDLAGGRPPGQTNPK